MKIIRIVSGSLAVVFLLGLAAMAGSGHRIYGTILTVDGDEFEGFIRWDRNEGSWVDLLNGTKELSRKNLRKSSRYRERKRNRESSIEILGLKIGRISTSFGWSNSAQSGIRIGHIRSLEVIGDDEALLILKSGDEVEFKDGSTDIGTSVREIIIEDDDEGEIELVWDDIERIDFRQAEGSSRSFLGERLYGTLTTRRGDEFTGYVCWDVDELFTSDILDGDVKNRSRKIKFGKIAAIERYSSSGANVTLVNGDELLLKGSNDVDDGNRGIIICDPDFGQVVVDWDEFDRLDFTKIPDNSVRYSDFDGGRALKGTVYTEDGEQYQGLIRWDNDEEYTWEILDGNHHNVEFDIEFGKIKSIEKRSYRSSNVTIWSGRTFRLRGSNDVDEDNKGIFITLDDGEEVEVEWEDFEKVEFTKK